LDWLTDPNAWIALCTLTVLEIVLGVDNIVFISILASKLPEEQRAKARSLGLALALFGRVVLLLSIGWVMSLEEPLFAVRSHDFSGRDLILLGGGLFLLAKATKEIHSSMEGGGHAHASGAASFGAVIAQILLLDVVFSLDSVITAVGMAKHVEIMIAAVVIAIGVMMIFAGTISAFVERHPTLKMLGLSFLLLIGVVLMADGFGQHVSKGYIYFAMAFSLFVEILNIRIRKPKAAPVHLHQSYVNTGEAAKS
jgi:predicted tellurium resistance membrane protein TerC